MKNQTIVNIVLALAIAGLYIIYFTGNKKGESAHSEMVNGTNKLLSIAYVKMDSMLFTYELAKKTKYSVLREKRGFQKRIHR